MLLKISSKSFSTKNISTLLSLIFGLAMALMFMMKWIDEPASKPLFPQEPPPQDRLMERDKQDIPPSLKSDLGSLEAAFILPPPPPISAPAPVSTPAPVLEPAPKPTITAMKPPVQPQERPLVKPLAAPKPPIFKEALKIPPLLRQEKPVKPKEAIKPLKAPTAKPMKREESKAPAPTPEPAPAVPTPAPTAAPAPAATAAPTPQQMVKKGRPLLKLMEFGKGPAINIAWPETSMEMQDLYKELSQCYGMKSLLLDGQNRLIDRGKPINPNRDFYSGFMRQASGILPYQEIKMQRQAGDGRIVRLFPRHVDALFLGALSALAGETFMEARISGRYHLDSQQKLWIKDLSVNGQLFQKKINLSSAKQCKLTG